MYWSAISTRLLVGMFTPAIRATDFSPVAGPSGTRPFHLKRYRALPLGEHDLFRKPVPTFRDHALARAGVHKREHDALPLMISGRGIVKNYPTGCRTY